MPFSSSPVKLPRLFSEEEPTSLRSGMPFAPASSDSNDTSAARN